MKRSSRSLLYVLCIPLLCLLAQESRAQRTYYVDAIAGSDTGSGRSEGYAWKSVLKVNRSKFAAGDRILFRRGATWRENLVVPSSGSPGKPIVFGAYGHGAKPQILGSLDKSSANEWAPDTGNIWKSVAKFNSDVGSLIFDHENSIGWKRDTKAAVSAQGDFWFNASDGLVYLYSERNPGSYYSHIEVVTLVGPHPTPTTANIAVSGKSYVTIQNLDIRYAGSMAVSLISDVEGITVENCDISYIGGSYLSGTLRAGNGIQAWNGGTDIAVRYCTFDQIYDAAMSPQGEGTYTFKRARFYYNVVKRSAYSFEFWINDATSSADSVFFENNTCIDGGGWSAPQRKDGNVAAHIKCYGSSGTLSNIFFRNNIFYRSVTSCLYFDTYWTDAMRAAVTIDYNCFYQPAGTMIKWKYGSNYSMSQFTAYQSATGKDAHSITADPQFASPNDFHLPPGSPCRARGARVDLDHDFDGHTVPPMAPVDIGAFQHSEPPAPPPSSEPRGEVPRNVSLGQNYPNPFNPTTTIRYEVPTMMLVSIKLYDVTGRLVRTLVNEVKDAGFYLTSIDAGGLASGVYYYCLQTGDYAEVRQCLLLK